jgi:hypothetical protein
MIDVETLIHEQLSELDLLPPGLSPDWKDVLARVQRPATARPERPRVRPRRLVFAAAIAAALFAVVSVVTPLGAAISRSLGDFSSWISGSPGTPASPNDQQAFAQENERSWDGFPEGTELRQLLSTEAAGISFKLFGFRTGESLCLRLIASGPGGGTKTSCAPVSALQQLNEPALVVDADEGFGTIGKTPPPNGYLPEKAAATFGIVSDGVKGVLVAGEGDDQQALLGGNAFLYVADHPALGSRVSDVKAIAGDGSEVALPFSRAPFGAEDNALDTPSGRPVTGPTGIERRFEDGTIAWLTRHEERGQAITAKEALPYDDLSRYTNNDPELFARLLTPPEGGATRSLLAWKAGELCYGFYFTNPTTGLADHQFECYPADQVFAGDQRLGGGVAPSPLRYNLEVYGGDQFAQFFGFVSDDVRELDLYLTDGSVHEVEIRNNVFATWIDRSMFPLRIVSRDKRGAIIGNRAVDHP